MDKLLGDIKRALGENNKKYLFVWILDISFYVLVFYRIFSCWRNSKFHIPALRIICEKIIEFVTHVHFPSSMVVGEGLHIYHGYGIVIHGKVVMGKNVTLYHRVTIGQRYPGDSCPIIGDNVVIGCNATILGPVTIPNNSIVPANSLVTPNALDKIKLSVR